MPDIPEEKKTYITKIRIRIDAVSDPGLSASTFSKEWAHAIESQPPLSRLVQPWVLHAKNEFLVHCGNAPSPVCTILISGRFETPNDTPVWRKAVAKAIRAFLYKKICVDATEIAFKVEESSTLSIEQSSYAGH